MGKSNKSKNKSKKAKAKAKAKALKAAKKEEVVVEVDISDDDNVEDHEVVLDSNQEDEDSTEPETVDEKVKDGFDTAMEEVQKLMERKNELQSSRVDLTKQLKELNQEEKKLEREMVKLLVKLPKLKELAVNKAKKMKRKRPGVSGGFTKNKPVPEPLIKYLDLESGVELPRSTVVSLLHKKFKEKGLSSGHDTILDQYSAKILGGKPKQKINMLHDFQRFVKDIYTNNPVES